LNPGGDGGKFPRLKAQIAFQAGVQRPVRGGQLAAGGAFAQMRFQPGGLVRAEQIIQRGENPLFGLLM